MKNTFIHTAGLSLTLFIIAGCSTLEIAKETPAETVKETPAKIDKEISVLDSCASTLDSLVEEARKTMHSTETICSGLRLEATPMWDMNYVGTVHVRVHDAEGKGVLDEMRTPQK